MKISVSLLSLKKISKLAQGICGQNSSIPILSNILLEAKDDNICITSTNLEYVFKATIRADVDSPGKISIPAKIFAESLEYLTGEKVSLEEESLNLKIRTVDNKASIRCNSPEEFPAVPEVTQKPFTIISGEILTMSLSQVIPLISASETRVQLAGVFCKFEKDKIKFIGTDGIRLAEKTIPVGKNTEQETQFILPQRAASEVVMLFGNETGDISISREGAQVVFDCVSQKSLRTEKEEGREKKENGVLHLQFFSRLIEGEFPQYEAIIPKETKVKAVLLKEEFAQKIKFASLYSSKFQEIRLVFKTGEPVVIQTSSAEVGEQSSALQAKSVSGAVEIVFNWKYLLDGLNLIKASEVSFGANDPQTPAIIRPIGDATYLYVLMPKTLK